MDRQERALIVMGVEQRKLLMPVHHIERVVNVKRDRSRRRRVARATQIELLPAQPNDLTERRRILPARYGRLGAQVCSAVRQSPAGNLKRRVGTHIIKIAGIFIATGNARMRARKMSENAWIVRAGSRRSAMIDASLSAIISFRSA